MMDGGKANGRSCRRSLEDVEEFLEHAKLKSSELLPERQILYFGDTVYDYKLLELNSDLLDAFTEGQNMVFRGVDGKKAVLCTDSQTFELLEAETSNSSLLVPDLNAKFADDDKLKESYLKERMIDSVFYSYYEPRKVKRIIVYELLSVLNDSLFNGQENELTAEDGTPLQRLYSMADLLNICQTSTKEMEDALRSIDACNINGFWRLLQFDYHLRVFTQLLNLVDSNSWPIDQIPEEEVVETLSDIFPEVIVRHILSLYLEPVYERTDEGIALCCYNRDKVCRFLGEALLRDEDSSEYDLERFNEAWQSSVPEGLITDLNQLDGLAVVVEPKNTNTTQIKLCSEREMPTNIADRFTHLSTIKSKWTLDQLTPYIKPLLPEKGNLKTIVMKYMHESTENDFKFYSCSR